METTLGELLSAARFATTVSHGWPTTSTVMPIFCMSEANCRAIFCSEGTCVTHQYVTGWLSSFPYYLDFWMACWASARFCEDAGMFELCPGRADGTGPAEGLLPGKMLLITAE